MMLRETGEALTKITDKYVFVANVLIHVSEPFDDCQYPLLIIPIINRNYPNLQVQVGCNIIIINVQLQLSLAICQHI